MDAHRDDIRRQLREIDQEHRETAPRFREALKRVFDRDADVPAAQRAGLLAAAPSRRTFFTVGGATVLGSAVLVGCSSAKKTQLTQTGSTPSTSASTTTTAPGSDELNDTLLRTTQSIEALAVDTYTQALNSGLLTSAQTSIATLFRDQHQEHEAMIGTAATDHGVAPFTDPNPFLKITIVTPALQAATDADAMVAALTVVEKTAAETYTYCGQTFTTVDLRSLALSIGPTEARHLSLLYQLQALNPVPLPFLGAADRVPEDGYIDKNGPVKIPDAPTTTTTAAGGA